MKLATVVALAAVAACDTRAPIKTATGMRIGGVEYLEEFARSENVPEVTFHGDRLRHAVELMDRHGVFALSGLYEAKGVLDSSTLSLTIRTKDDRETKIVVKNCAESHVCAFFVDAVNEGVVQRLPLVCKSSASCSR